MKKWVKALLQLAAGLVALWWGIAAMGGDGESFNWIGWLAMSLGIMAAFFAAETLVFANNRYVRWR